MPLPRAQPERLRRGGALVARGRRAYTSADSNFLAFILSPHTHSLSAAAKYGTIRLRPSHCRAGQLETSLGINSCENFSSTDRFSPHLCFSFKNSEDFCQKGHIRESLSVDPCSGKQQHLLDPPLCPHCTDEKNQVSTL